MIIYLHQRASPGGEEYANCPTLYLATGFTQLGSTTGGTASRELWGDFGGEVAQTTSPWRVMGKRGRVAPITLGPLVLAPTPIHPHYHNAYGAIGCDSKTQASVTI